MKWFCPFCWKEIKETDEVCPFCKKNLKEFHKLPFEKKLILSLKNPVLQNRMFVIQILGRIKSKEAVEPLCKHLKQKLDTYETIETLKSLYHIGTAEAIDCIKNFLKTCNNKLILNFAKKYFHWYET